MARLDASLEPGRRLILVSAAAGFGKTTLLATWLRDADIAAGWLALDEADNDLARFLRYLRAALMWAVPDLTVPPPTGSNQPVEPLLVAWINHIAAHSERVVLVLDDYHLITTAAIHEAIAFLVDHAPPNLRLVIATRADPALPLPRWRARQYVVELRAEALRFNRAETQAFMQAMLDAPLDSGALTALEQRAEGWIAALQLVALSLRDREDVAGFVAALSGSHRYILDYLVEEVLQRQSPTRRQVLLHTAILERLSAPLCAAVLEQTEQTTQATLVQLERANLFLMPLDDERRWYRYHHLFRDFLQARLELETPDRVPGLHRRASKWYAATGSLEDAIHHALSVPDHELAGELIGRAYPAALQRGEIVNLRRWLDALPTELRRNNLALVLAEAWTRAISLEMDDLDAILTQLEHLAATVTNISPEDRAAVRGEILTIRTLRALALGDIAGTISNAEAALALLPEEEGVLRSVVAQNLGNAYSHRGSMQEAAAAYTQALNEGRRSGNLFLAFSAMLNLGELQRLHGRWQDAEHLYLDALAWIEAHGAQPLDGIPHVGLGLIYWDQWDLRQARHHLELGLDLCHRTGAQSLEVTAAGTLACLAQHQGEPDEARRWLERAETVSRSLDYAEATGYVMLLGAQCQIARGDLVTVKRWIDRREPIKRVSVELRTLEACVVARAHLALGDAQGALHELRGVRDRSEAEGWTQRRVEALALEAIAHDMLADRPKALDCLETALDLSQADGFRRPFAETGEAMALLLQAIDTAAAPGGHRAFVETICTPLAPPPRCRGPVKAWSSR
ncbi:MAG: tetratricopeptide repeat protein [Anaerolineae bacterium]|nr:tetratricopeptide repeat protein [Anaerolineae bacterium]